MRVVINYRGGVSINVKWSEAVHRCLLNLPPPECVMRDKELKDLVQSTRLQSCMELEKSIQRIVTEVNKQKITNQTNFLQVHIADDCLAAVMQMQHDLHTLWQTL